MQISILANIVVFAFEKLVFVKNVNIMNDYFFFFI